ncbi:hypothetical protein SAMN04487868_106145 [Marinobacter salarius]|uniref:DUF2726 domain-containing protein n=1 Tax=Marinobacter salarius TaxID=1420917 RepID=A0ABY1FMV0_9GAMM|nr:MULTISPECIES: DUF2726 domain-containing protein [Marinobacter]KXJ44670.1 MAG: hypothetical protein AXW11_14680 [Marinobacter sp. Hex_13]SFL67156.1 hypothetical protein SAMN04487868_106145 [Marinobacter salarius]
METDNRNEFEKKPLVHAHVNAVAEMLKREFRTRSTSEFWHIPKNAVFPKANPQGIYDWVLAESVISKGKMLDHRPLVAIEYKPGSSLKVWPSPEEPSLVVVSIGASDSARAVAELILDEHRKRKSATRNAQFLRIPGFQLKIRSALEGSDLIALQEVALSEIGSISSGLRSSISAKAKIRPESEEWVPGRRRFDVVIATPPPMCLALAAIEIDGRTHGDADNLGDRLKNAYCASVGVPLIRIEIGSHLDAALNHRQDEFVSRYVGWLIDAIKSPSFDIETIPDFLASIRDIANKANAEVRQDLLALIEHSNRFFQRLSHSIESAIGPNVPPPIGLTPVHYRYENWDEIGYPELAHSVVDTQAMSIRRGDDLFLKIQSKWGGATCGLNAPDFPKEEEVGPLRIRVIGSEKFRKRFHYFAEFDVANEHWRKHNEEGLKALGITCQEEFDEKIQEWQFLDDLSASNGNFNKVFSIVERYLPRKPDGNWDEVEWSSDDWWNWGKSKPKELWGEPRSNRWYRASIEYCMKFWSSRRDGFQRKAESVTQAIESKSPQLSQNIKDDVLLILDDYRDAWRRFDDWAQSR